MIGEQVIQELETHLNQAYEEPIQQFLQQNPQFILRCFGDRWAVNDLIAKFRFGNEFVSDFVIVTGQSGFYNVKLIELEPANAKIFNNNGSYGSRLNAAFAQIHNWIIWIENNREYFAKSLAKGMKSAYGARQIVDIRGKYSISAAIIIGKREMLSEKDNERRNSIKNSSHIEIVPYDRLLERAKKNPDF